MLRFVIEKLEIGEDCVKISGFICRPRYHDSGAPDAEEKKAAQVIQKSQDEYYGLHLGYSSITQDGGD